MKEKVVLIPLHLTLNYPCDYIDQTAKILSKKNLVILYDFNNLVSWKKIINLKKHFLIIKKNLKLIKNKNKGIVYFQSPALLPFQKNSIISSVNKLLGFIFISFLLIIFKKKVILWQFFPLITSKLIKLIFNQKFIYDCVDYLDIEIHGQKVINEEKKLIKLADYIAFNSKPLYKKKLLENKILKNKKTIITVCGTNYPLFNLKPELNKNNIAIIYGVLDYRLNTLLILKTIKKLFDWHFYILGPIQKQGREAISNNFSKIIQQENVKYFGHIPKNNLKEYLKKAKVGLVPYNTKFNFVKYSNPMKVYEYLAAGIPVVSTKILSLEKYPKDIIFTTNNVNDFINAIKRLTNDWNIEKIKKAKKIAKNNSWENKIKIILKNININ